MAAIGKLMVEQAVQQMPFGGQRAKPRAAKLRDVPPVRIPPSVVKA